LNALSDYGSCNREDQFSQEARWASAKGGPLESVVGTFFSHQDLEVDSRVKFGTQYNIWAANPSTSAFPNIGTKTWASGAYANALNGFGIASVAHFHTDTQAIFGNTTWHPDADRKWSIDLGLRETWEEKRMSYNGAVTSNPGGLDTAEINVMSAAGANAQLGQADDAVSDSSLSGQAAVSYRFTPSLMGYVQFARGYKSKGFNLLPENSSNPDPNVALAIAHGASQAIKGETTNDWEAGLKTEWLSHRLLLNGTIFDTLVMDAQAQEAIGVGNTATKFLANVGAERSEGVELEGEAFPIAGLHLKGFLAYDWAYYDSFRNSVCPPETTALTCNLTGREVAYWRSEQNTTIILDPTANIKPYALMNLRVGTLLQRNSVDVQFWVENLMDKHYYINLLGLTKSTGIIQGYPGDPRTFGVTVKVRF
jgi:iron complex outermembrane receptor protein